MSSYSTVFQPVEDYHGADPFIEKTQDRIRRAVGDERVYIAVSGGVDSSAVAGILCQAIGDRLAAEHYDHGGMREGEPPEVVNELNRFFPVTLYDASDRFGYAIMKAGSDSDKKRVNGVSVPYFLTMLERAKNNGCRFVADGTIRPDWEETIEKKLKYQHNIPNGDILMMYKEAGIEFLHPLFYQAKPQSREICAHYGMSSERRPFPGPGLYVRAIGKITTEKMRVVRKADSVATPMLGRLVERLDNGLDKQYFCAVMESKRRTLDSWDCPQSTVVEPPEVFRSPVTGMKDDRRTYRKLMLIESDNSVKSLIEAANEIVRLNEGQDVGRVALKIADAPGTGRYTALLRAVETRDFRTASVPPLARSGLKAIASELFDEIPELDSVAFDITPKPVSTIEFE